MCAFSVHLLSSTKCVSEQNQYCPHPDKKVAVGVQGSVKTRLSELYTLILVLVVHCVELVGVAYKDYNN